MIKKVLAIGTVGTVLVTGAGVAGVVVTGKKIKSFVVNAKNDFVEGFKEGYEKSLNNKRGV